MTRRTRGFGSANYVGPMGSEVSVVIMMQPHNAFIWLSLTSPPHPHTHSQDEDVLAEKKNVAAITSANDSQAVVIRNLFKVLSVMAMVGSGGAP